MGKLYFHCGEYDSAPKDAEVLGSLKWTCAQMSATGYQLQPPPGDTTKSVFSNSSDIANGVRLAIHDGKIDPASFAFVFHSQGGQLEIGVGKDGDLKDMAPGFFDQAEIDLAQLL